MNNNILVNTVDPTSWYQLLPFWMLNAEFLVIFLLNFSTLFLMDLLSDFLSESEVGVFNGSSRVFEVGKYA